MRTREATLVKLGHVGQIYFKQLAQLSQPHPILILLYSNYPNPELQILLNYQSLS